MFGLLKMGNEATPKGMLVIARLNSRIEPLDRGEVFEDPLAEILEETGLGEVTGGGSMLGPDGEITFIDIEIMVRDRSDEALEGIALALDTLGAPKGSILFDDENRTLREFGRYEGLGIYLDGVNLPVEVYQAVSTEDVVGACHAVLGDAGRYHGSRSMAGRTALYFYGPNFKQMKDSIASAIPGIALCENALVEKVA